MNFGSATLAGIVSGDSVTIDSSGYSAHFDTKSAGNNKPVTVAGVAPSGADSASYTVSQPSGLTANVTKRDATASISAGDKTYDGNDAATITDCSLNAQSGNAGVIGGDDVDCSGSNAHFNNKNAGANKPVTANVSLTGGDAGNYQLTSPTSATNASINKRKVTASITAANKTYDGIDDENITSCSLEAQDGNHGVLSGEAVGCSASNGKFNDRHAGLNKAVTADIALTGGDAVNYELTNAAASTTANINNRAVTPSITAADKTYDGTDAASITGCSLEAQAGDHGVIGSDAVDCAGSNGHFDTKDAGSNKTVTAVVALTGADAGDYQLTSSSASTEATINRRNVTASISASGKIYDGNADAAVTDCSLEAQASDHGRISSDDVDCSASNGHFNNKNAGVNKAVSADVALTGSDQANYLLTSPTATTTATIEQRQVTASITAADKIYDGNDHAAISSCSLESQDGNHGVIGSDDVDCAGTNGHFDNKNAGAGKTVTADIGLTGADKDNYVLTSSSASTTATINKRDVTASISAADKTYDGSDAATISDCSLNAATGNVGAISGDDIDCVASNAHFNNKNAGLNKPVSADVALAGDDKDNYNLTSSSAETTASISKRNVTASITAAGKTYNGNDSAAITSCTLETEDNDHGVISPDAVGCHGSNGHFNNKNAGVNKTVTADVALTGSDQANYQLTSLTASTTADIDKRDVTASISAASKVYDSTDAASITACSLDAQSGHVGKIAGDNVDCSGSNGHFDNKNAGLNKPVTADVALTGADKDNYQLTSGTASTTANIDKREVTASISASEKVYDGNNNATTTGCSLEAQTGDHGVIGSEDVGCNGSNGHFTNENAGLNKLVTADVALTGADKDNYLLTSATATTTANITKRDVTASITAADKVYDGTDAVVITSCSLEPQAGDHGTISGDAVGCAGSNGHLDNKNAGLNKSVTAILALTGADQGNYQLTSPTAVTTANVNRRNVTASITAANKIYDRTTAATITNCTLEPQTSTHGVVSPDAVGCSATNGQFGSASAGNGKTVTADVELTGADQANYQLTSTTSSTTANIAKREVTASVTAADKVYNSTNSASITGCTLESETGNHGVISPDDVSCSGSNGHFDNENAGSNKPVTADVALSGADKASYQLTSGTAATTANISKRDVTASITAANKVYDSDDSATINSCSLDSQSGDHGAISGDGVGCSASMATSTTRTPATERP